MDESSDHEEQAASLRRSRAGKKGYITRLINLMRRLVSESGSRRQLNLLMPKLLEALEDTRKINDQVLQLSGNDTDDVAWIEDVNFVADVAVTEVQEYLEARAGDPESTGSLTESWVQRHCWESSQQENDDEYVDAPSVHVSDVISSTVADPSVGLFGTAPGFGIPEKSVENLVYKGLAATGLQTSTGEEFRLGSTRFRLGASNAYAGGLPKASTSKVRPSSFSAYRNTTNTNWDHSDVTTSFHNQYKQWDGIRAPSNHHYSQSAIRYGAPPGIPSTGLGQSHYVPSSYGPPASAYGVQGMHPGVFAPASSGYGVPGGTTSSVFAPLSSTCGVQADMASSGFAPPPSRMAGTPSSVFDPPSCGYGVPPGTSSSGLGARHSHSFVQNSSASFGGTRPRTSCNIPTNTSSSGLGNATRGAFRSSRGAPMAPGGTLVLANEVDAWIDNLDENVPTCPPHSGINPTAPDVAVAFLVQQQLPRPKIPEFNGSPTTWVDFITKFRDMVHDQSYLNDRQRSFQLLQALTGQPKRAVKQYGNDTRGYVLALKRLKYLFGQKSKIAAATLHLVTKGETLKDNDVSGLEEFYYTVSDCVINLELLRYDSDLFSSDTLRQAVRRLPPRLLNKWSEHILVIRGRSAEEPNLYHFERWLQNRLLAMKEAYLPESRNQKPKKPPDERCHSNFTKASPATAPAPCSLCEGRHAFWKCETYKSLSDQKKFDTVKKSKRCFNCLSSDHPLTQCTSKATCFRCHERHHTSLHDFYEAKKAKDSENPEKEKGEEGRTEDDERKTEKKDINVVGGKADEAKGSNDELHTKATMTSSHRSTYLWVVPIEIHGPKGDVITTHALLDNCSQRSLLRDDIAEKLGIHGQERGVDLTSVCDKNKVVFQEVDFDISSKGGGDQFSVENAYVVPKDTFNMPAQPPPPVTHNGEKFTHLDGILDDLEEVKAEQISILVGADVPESLLPVEVRRGTRGEPLAIKTVFGWTLFGVVKTQALETHIAHLQAIASQRENPAVERLWEDDEEAQQVQKVSVNLIQINSDDALSQNLERFWVQENQAISPIRDTAMSTEDEEALRRLETETRFIDGHYEVPMLWKDSSVPLEDDAEAALKRYWHLMRRFRADPVMGEKYVAIVKDYLAKNYCRKLSAEEARKRSSKTRHLPHHPVLNPNKPGKVRIVFDAASKVNGVSLNDRLISGPDIMNSLVGVILRFRIGRYAISADIEAYFHQVRVPNEDADSLRFFWTDDISSKSPPYTMQMLVHIFGAKDSATCAIHALRQAARDNHADLDGSTYETLLKSFYVEDLLKSLSDEEQLLHLALELIELCRRCGFRLTKFLSNSKSVANSLPQSEISPSAFLDIDAEHIERALGLRWDINRDAITFSSALKEGSPNKRGILGTSTSLFDPAGFLAPFLLKPKLLLQVLWMLGVDWDQTLDEEHLKLWRKWLEAAKKVEEIKLDRCYNLSEEPVEEIQLHLFCDASEKAFGAVAYLRFKYKTGGFHCCFVMAKSKVAPIKTVTLPRLELNSAVAAVRLYRTIIHEIDLPIVKTYFWSDSELTVQYISNKTTVSCIRS